MVKNHLAKTISRQKEVAATVAMNSVKDTLYVVSACIADELYARGYKKHGIKNFMDRVFDRVQDFVDNAKGEYIENGYTKHRNLDYAIKRIVQRQEEIMEGEALVYDISELMELFLKKVI